VLFISGRVRFPGEAWEKRNLTEAEELALLTVIKSKREASPVPTKVSSKVVQREAKKIYAATHLPTDSVPAMGSHWNRGFLARTGLSLQTPTYVKAPPGKTKGHKISFRDPRSGQEKLQEFWKERYIITTLHGITAIETFFLDETRDHFDTPSSTRTVEDIGAKRALCRTDAPHAGYSVVGIGCGVGDVLSPVVSFTGVSNNLKFDLPPFMDTKPVLTAVSPSSFVDMHIFDEIIMGKVILPYSRKRNMSLSLDFSLL
jgi:hypothetical protein